MSNKKSFIPNPTIAPDTPLSETIIPARARNVLIKMGINTIGELNAADTLDWWFARDLGIKSVSSIEDALEIYGFRKYGDIT